MLSTYANRTLLRSSFLNNWQRRKDTAHCGELQGRENNFMLPPVTTILDIVKQNYPVSDQILEAAQVRGTIVHKVTTNYARGIWTPSPPEYKGYIKSFTDWFEEYVEEVLMVEELLEDKKLGFCGHEDLILRLKGDQWPSLWDLKTPTTHLAIWRLQLSAYKKLALKKFPQLDRIGSIRLDSRGGKPKIKDYTTYNEDIVVFLSLLNVYRFFEGAR